MKIIIAGKHELACEIFEKLHREKKHVLGTITCQSEGKSRVSFGHKLTLLGVKPLNRDYSHEGFFQAMQKFRPDLVVSAGFDKIIKPEIIRIFPCVNIHFGELPKYRGNFSIPHAILNHEKYIGITLHQINEGIDSGRIISQVKIINDSKKSCYELYQCAVNCGVKLLDEYLIRKEKIPEDLFSCQREAEATYYPLEFPHGFRIPWHQLTTYVADYIRAAYFPPYRPAYSTIDGKKIYFNFPVICAVGEYHNSCGKVIVHKKEAWVTTLNGLIKPQDVIYHEKKYHFQDFVKKNKLSGKIFK